VGSNAAPGRDAAISPFPYVERNALAVARFNYPVHGSDHLLYELLLRHPFLDTMPTTVLWRGELEVDYSRLFSGVQLLQLWIEQVFISNFRTMRCIHTQSFYGPQPSWFVLLR
jgi:hypothetical protein